MAEDLLDTIGQLFGPMRGGLAFAVIFVGALLAATTGVVAASVISMGLISLPIMLRYGYDRRLASGVIAASGTLAQIIPPSLVLIVMADQLGKSVGDMYAGAFLPGHGAGRPVRALRGRRRGLQAAMGAGPAARSARLPRAERQQRHAVADRAGDRRRRGGRAHSPTGTTRSPTRRSTSCWCCPPRSASASPSSASVINHVTQARPALAHGRARDLRADSAAGADLPRARHHLPRRGDADRGRRDGRHRRAGSWRSRAGACRSACCARR